MNSTKKTYRISNVLKMFKFNNASKMSKTTL